MFRADPTVQRDIDEFTFLPHLQGWEFIKEKKKVDKKVNPHVRVFLFS